MTTTQSLIAFSATAAILTITPGLDTALVLRTAMVEGPRRAMLAALGICLGCLAWGVAASVGLGALLSASRLAYSILRAAGAAYLVWLGATMLAGARHRAPSPEDDAPPREPRTVASRWFVRGFMTNALNPKVGVFYITLLPQFVPANAPVAAFSVLLALIHALEGLLWFAVLARATQQLSRWLRRPEVARMLDRITGVVLIGFGAKLALSHQR